MRLTGSRRETDERVREIAANGTDMVKEDSA